MDGVLRRNKTIVKKKDFAEGTARFDLFRHARQSLNAGIALKECVKR